MSTDPVCVCSCMPTSHQCVLYMRAVVVDMNTELAMQDDEECSSTLKNCVRTKGQHCVQKVLPHNRSLRASEINPHTPHLSALLPSQCSNTCFC